MPRRYFKAKRLNPGDRHVGARLRLRRTLAGLSRSQLGVRAGLTAQQVQKYENGEIRFSASVLYCIARALDAPIGYFFTDMDTALQLLPMRSNQTIRANLEELVQAYCAIPNGLRQPLYELLARLAEKKYPLW